MNLKRSATGTAPEASGPAEKVYAPTMPMTAVFLLICALVAIILGLYRIDYYSIWLDESTTLTVSSDWNILKAYLKAFPEQHPLYYFAIKWLGVNHTLLQIRYFSLVCGVLGIFPLYYIGRRIFSLQTARTACIFYVLSPIILYYNQDGRMYTLFILLCLVQASLLIKWTLDGHRASKYGFAILSAVLMYTHFFASFLLACEFIWLLVTRGKNAQGKIRFREAVVIYILVGLAYIPWLLNILSNIGQMHQGWRNPYNIAFALPYTFFRFGAGYGIFPLNYDVKLHLREYLPAALFWGAALCLAYLPAAMLLARRARKVTAVQGLAYIITFVPIIMIVAASFFKNVASERYVIYSAPFFYLIVASAQESAAQAGRFLKICALGFPILLFVLGIGFYYFNPDFGKTNYKAAAAYVVEEGSKADRVVCSPDIVADMMHYYLKNRMTVTPYRSWEAGASDRDVWLVERMANNIVLSHLAGYRYEKISETVFPQENGLRVTRWRLSRRKPEAGSQSGASRMHDLISLWIP